jgi:hypothetical protein
VDTFVAFVHAYLAILMTAIGVQAATMGQHKSRQTDDANSQYRYFDDTLHEYLLNVMAFIR